MKTKVDGAVTAFYFQESNPQRRKIAGQAVRESCRGARADSKNMRKNGMTAQSTFGYDFQRL